MKKRYNKYNKIISLANIRVYLIVIALNILFFPTLTTYSLQGNNRFTIYMGDTMVGVTDEVDTIYDCYREAKRRIAGDNGDMVFTEYKTITYTGEEVVYGEVDRDETIIKNMTELLAGAKVETMSRGYSIKVNDVVVNLSSSDEVKDILQSAIDRYDMQGKFTVSLTKDTTRELNVLVASIDSGAVKATDDIFVTAGMDSDFNYSAEELGDISRKGFDSFDYGIESMAFSEDVEIVEAYMPTSEIMDIEYARDRLLNEQEIQQIYKVQSGDTLSEISMTVGLPLDDIIALNEDIENESTPIHVDQEIIITVPKPELSVVWTECAKLEEAYNLPIEYTYNDEWYTNESVTHVQPSAGYHEAVLEITHVNEEAVDKETLYEEILLQAVAKQVEIGTITPPTYIKPIAGGRLTSGFGYRNSPTRGASSYHKGIDWGCPIGTTVCASSGGTVTKAGWSGGYGYCVLITHPNGYQTRYGHLSRIYVSAGEYVSQGQAIAASGNSGVSTGPHLHFEILVNGTQVNPLNYL